LGQVCAKNKAIGPVVDVPEPPDPIDGPSIPLILLIHLLFTLVLGHPSGSLGRYSVKALCDQVSSVFNRRNWTKLTYIVYAQKAD
jgi:hypothetical protein